MFLRTTSLQNKIFDEVRSARNMPVVKLFNGEEFVGTIIEERNSELVIEDSSKPKRVIPKRDIFSIDF
jgi:hypothetical protein